MPVCAHQMPFNVMPKKPSRSKFLFYKPIFEIFICIKNTKIYLSYAIESSNSELWKYSKIKFYSIVIIEFEFAGIQ